MAKPSSSKTRRFLPQIEANLEANRRVRRRIQDDRTFVDSDRPLKYLANGGIDLPRSDRFRNRDALRSPRLAIALAAILVALWFLYRTGN